MRFKEPTTTHRVSAPLEAIRRRLARWRRTRKPHARIPEGLWASAVTVARACGLNRTARTLGLDYYSLKERLETAGYSGRRGQKARPAFVELVSPAPTSIAECTVEFEHPRGRKMKVQLKGLEAPDLVALGSAFWRAK